MSKEVALTENKELANIEEFDTSVFDDFSGEGFGDVTSSDFMIPRLAVIGTLSPELKKTNAKYIEGAVAGDLVDVAMGQLFKEVNILPVARVKEWIKWAPRSTGKGIIDRFDYDYIAEKGLVKNERNEFIDHTDKANPGCEVIETWQFYCLNLSASEYGRRCFMPMKKSNLKVARRWFGQMAEMTIAGSGRKAPLFYSTWNVGSFVDSGGENEWHNFTITKGDDIVKHKHSKEIIANAIDFLNQIKSGEVKGQDEEVDHDPETGEVPF